MEENKKLQMRFAPNTIEHLGVRMYSTLPPVIAELIANSYDADATNVEIYLNDINDKEIIVRDNGHGMSFDEINEKFLIIGRNRRVKNETDISPKGRKIIGKKGLGKLSFFGISHEIEICTVKDKKENIFVMNWDQITKTEDNENGIENYEPKILSFNKNVEKENGTNIILRKIQRKSDFNASDLADNISRYFIIEKDFNIEIIYNNKTPIIINNERKYLILSAQVKWDIPEDIEIISDYKHKNDIVGHLLTTEKPISPSTNMRGITLFSRKKLVNLPEYFSDSTSSHFFNYLTGWLEVDFIDELDEDVIGTNRQSLNWDHPEIEKLRIYLQNILRFLERDWRKKRNEIRKDILDKELKKKGITVREWQKNVPNEINKSLTPILEAVIGKSEFSNEVISGTIQYLKKILPPYTFYHYQNLHKVLSKEVFEYYKKEDYYGAVFEGMKRYIQEVKRKTKSPLTDRALLENIFAVNKPSWSVVQKFKRPSGTDFHHETINNITEGHRKLVIATWQAFRDPISHDPMKDLRDSGLYTEQDCLDALGILSHLFRRLDDIKKI